MHITLWIIAPHKLNGTSGFTAAKHKQSGAAGLGKTVRSHHIVAAGSDGLLSGADNKRQPWDVFRQPAWLNG